MEDKIEFTGMYDDNHQPIYLDDFLKSRDCYYVQVKKDSDGYYGKLICKPGHSCENIPYHLNNGKGHLCVQQSHIERQCGINGQVHSYGEKKQ